MGNFTNTYQDVRNLTCRPRDNLTLGKELEGQCHMSYFAYVCKTEGKNGISRLISALCVNCLISIPEYSRIIESGCASGVDYFRNFTKLKNLNF